MWSGPVKLIFGSSIYVFAILWTCGSSVLYIAATFHAVSLSHVFHARKFLRIDFNGRKEIYNKFLLKWMWRLICPKYTCTWTINWKQFAWVNSCRHDVILKTEFYRISNIRIFRYYWGRNLRFIDYYTSDWAKGNNQLNKSQRYLHTRY